MTSPFAATFLSEPFSSSYDPSIFSGEHFADGQHRVMVMDLGADVKRLYKTADFETFTLIDGDWMSSVPQGGTNTFQGHVVLPDGTFVLYQNDGSETATAVWTGDSDDIDNATITRQGRVLDGGGDCGVYYDPDADLVHIFTEDPDSPFGSVSSSKLLHWTTPGDSLLSATQLADAVNTGGTWGTGDPCIIKQYGRYWMFTDYTTSHPAYWIALYTSTDLTTWTLVDDKFTESTGVRGGDFDIVAHGDHLIAMSEYTDANQFGVGVWRLDRTAFKRALTTVGGGRRRITSGGSLARLTLYEAD